MSLSAGSLTSVRFCSGLVNVEQVTEFLKTLLEQNTCRMKSASTGDHGLVEAKCLLLPFKSSAAEYIMHLCDQWKFSVEVKFTAIEIYYKFLSLLLVEIFQSIYSKTESTLEHFCSMEKRLAKCKQYEKQRGFVNIRKIQIENQDNLWTQTMEHIAGQMELRAVTCVSIASKLFSHYSHVTYNMATDFLALRGLKYKPCVFLKSEIRILKTLKFNIGSLPLVLPYISALLDLLFMEEQRSSVQEIYQLCIDLMVCFYSRCHLVYETFFKDAKKSNENKFNLKIGVVVNDMVLLSCGIIASATYLKSKSKSDSIVKMLSELTEVSQETIAKFSYVLLEESLK